ncbi:MAG: cyclic nucleotide-binding domain-containing protein [Deltaproteobacteria bacterium]|nr:cyclic nucleotide-binding domain-containing protein [Deltaproteobacteria bacterium]
MGEKAAVHTRSYSAGTTLFEENDPGSRMYVIRSGRVRIYRRLGDRELALATLSPGDFFGEMALLEGLPRSANAQALEACELVEVDADTLEQMIRNRPEVAVRMMRKLASRVRELDSRLENLLVDNGLGRALEVLRLLTTKGRREGEYVRLDAATVHVGIAAQAGMQATEVHQVIARLREAGCLKDDGADVLVAGTQILDEFGAFLDLKRRYEPAEPLPGDLGEALVGDRRQAVERLLSMLQISADSPEGKTLSNQYQRYQALRQRFEGGKSSVA